MKKLLLPLLVLAVTVPAVAAGGKTYLGACSTSEHARFKPKHVLVACGDGSFYVNHIKWSKWGANKARGKGRAHVNTCTPSCAQGKFRRYKVKLRADVPATCPGRKSVQFSRLTVRFGKKHPKGVKRTQTARLCGK
jgi:hypothetical protein